MQAILYRRLVSGSNARLARAFGGETPSSYADLLRIVRAAKRQGEAAAVWPPGYRLALG
jgi:hypothetical protein